MGKFRFRLIVGLMGLLFSYSNAFLATEKPYNRGLNITPLPSELTQKTGLFKLNKGVVLIAVDERVKKVGAYFAAKIEKSTGYSLNIYEKRPESNYINLSLDPDLPVNDEGYLLDITTKAVELQARSPQGLFYGMQTVMQLLPAEIESPTLVTGVSWNIPAVSIKDEPRFKYRGMHLDVCRHFASVNFIKKQLDLLSMFKINKFHWHLTDDQGWRIEVKKYPRLTEIGSKRVEGEGNEYGPAFYTQEQVKEIVAYAKERFIEVIPEIELPGHAVAAIAAYPELSCTGKCLDVRNIWAVSNDVYCAGNDFVFQFIEDVLTEVIPLFESEYLHIGGDECPKGRWKTCPKCQDRINKLGFLSKDGNSAEDLLQSYFVQRIEKFLLKHNKKIIGWDEILEGGLAHSATIMSWRGERGGIAAANMGHDVIMTPGEWMYLDKFQGESKVLPVTIGGYLPLKKVYGYEPVPEKIPADKKHHILGVQSNVWTEYKYNEEDIEHDIYPRIIALSELSWTPKEKKEYKDFERRIDNQRVRLDMHGVNYYIPIPENKGTPSCNFIAFTESVTLEFKTTEPANIVYTIDGSEPGLKSEKYLKPLIFTENTILKIRSILLSDKMSPVRSITIEKQKYAPIMKIDRDSLKGIKVEYYKGIFRTAEELKGKIPEEIDYISIPQDSKHQVNDYREVLSDDLYSTVLTGYINIPKDAVYYFSTDHELWMDGNLLISNTMDNNGTAHKFSNNDKSIALSKGPHSFKLIRLGAIFGGFPTQWEKIFISIRKEGEPDFNHMDRSYFM